MSYSETDPVIQCPTCGAMDILYFGHKKECTSQSVEDDRKTVDAFYAREYWISRGGDPVATDEDIRLANEADDDHDGRWGCYCCCTCHNGEDY